MSCKRLEQVYFFGDRFKVKYTIKITGEYSNRIQKMGRFVFKEVLTTFEKLTSMLIRKLVGTFFQFKLKCIALLFKKWCKSKFEKKA
jgi:hypothetical protein